MYHHNSLDLQFLKGFAFSPPSLPWNLPCLLETKDTLNWPDLRSWDLRWKNLDCINSINSKHVNNVSNHLTTLTSQYTQYTLLSLASGDVTRRSFRAEFPEASYRNRRVEHQMEPVLLANHRCHFHWWSTWLTWQEPWSYFQMWEKQCHKPPIWEWFIPPIYGDLGDGLLLFYPHCRVFLKKTLKTWGRGWMTKASGVGERRKGRGELRRDCHHRVAALFVPTRMQQWYMIYDI